jgi:hypothetical protein
MKVVSLSWRKLIIGVVVLFLSMVLIPVTESLPFEEEQSLMAKGCSDGIVLNGTMGQNGWYISPVFITFENENGSWVQCFVRIDGGDWFVYTEPIVVATEGAHSVFWYYVDQYGNQSSTFSVTFKIDMIPPSANVTFHRKGCTILVSIDASDTMSGVNLIEIYSDGVLIGSLTVPPYEFSWTVGLFGEHTTTIIIYDAAGLSCSVSFTFPYSFIQSRLLHQQILQTFQNLMIHHQLLIEPVRN